MAMSRIKDGGLPLINLIRLEAMPILQQLHLEERLLRTSSDNWCIINDGNHPRAIVMGISGQPSQLIELESVLRDQIPVIRRFSGGGTVIVDDGTIFVTLICNKDAIPGLQPYPHPIMHWTGQLYARVFQGAADFHLRENDYVFGERKFGGNAQSITKDKWIHHTSFLWEYDKRNMAYLKQPKRAPKYRSARRHDEFLCQLKDHLPSRSTFIERTISAIRDRFSIKYTQLEEISLSSNKAYPASTRLMPVKELQEVFASPVINI